jgi:opacity protein-like surface antigen
MKNTIFGRLALAPLALLLAGGATALSAQDDSMRFGAGLQIVSPLGDSGNGEAHKVGDFAAMGFGITILGEIGLADRHALRGRVEYHIFGEKTRNEVNLNTTAMTVFADYIFRFDSHAKGIYAFGGVGVVNGSIKYSQGGQSETEEGGGLGFSVGLGYNFSRNLGAEASYVTASGVEFGDRNWPIDLNWIQLSFKYRF